MRVPRFVTALLTVPTLASLAHADFDPVLIVSGVNGSSTTTLDVPKQSTVQLTLTGTPGAPFALLVSANSGAGQPHGFNLSPWTVPFAGILSPVHSVLDGIGTGYIAAQLGLPATTFAPSSAVPFFRFGPAGSLSLGASLPASLPLMDSDPSQPAGFPFGPGQPIPYPLEEPFSLHLQVVSVDTQTLALRVGNAVRLDLLGSALDATIALSIGVDPNPASTTLGAQQTLATVIDDNLCDTTFGPSNPSSDFAGTFGGMTDVWMIQLGGPQEAVASAATELYSAPDSQLELVQSFASSLEFGTGDHVARDNENPEFPRIRLPGKRQLFQWRNGGTIPPTYGFGLLFEETGTYRNLIPASFGSYSENATLSPWEAQVAVTPDGNRAVVVLDRTTDSAGGFTFDRLFVLNLEENGTFANGQPIIEAVVSTPNNTRRIYEESIAITTDGAGSWVAWLATTTSTSLIETTRPDSFWRVDLNAVVPTTLVLPSASFPAIVDFDEQVMVNGNHDVLCLIARSATQEDVYSITAVTPQSFTFTNITMFPPLIHLAEGGPVSDGTPGFAELLFDGSMFAGARSLGTVSRIPFVAPTDGSGAGTVVDLVRDISVGGLFDLDDFPYGLGYHLSDDGGHLLFHQGRFKSGAQSDHCDLFVIDLATLVTRNLTRTISGAPYDSNPTAKFLGPWDLVSPSLGAPTVDYGGSFMAPDRRHRFLFRDRHLSTSATDVFNLYAVDVEPGAGGTSPSFMITNVTGKEFEPTFGTPPPTTGAIDTVTTSGFFTEQTPSYFRPRRIGGAGPLKDFYFFTARPGLPASPMIDQIFLFDSANPGPAIQVTNFGPTSTPIATHYSARIRNVTPHHEQPVVAFVLHHDSTVGVANQELIVQPLLAGAVPVTVPQPGSPAAFNRCITAGSIHWLPGATSALVWSHGATPRSYGPTDGVGNSQDAGNPVDATPWFLTFADPTNPRKIVADAAAGSARSAMIWSVR